MFVNSTTTYTEEKFLSFHSVEGKSEWIPVEHSNFEEMIAMSKKGEIYTHWQKEGIHIIREIGLTVDLSTLRVNDIQIPGYPAWQLNVLMPSKKFTSAWIGENPLKGLFEDLPEELNCESKGYRWLKPNWYPVSSDGEVYQYLHIPTTSKVNFLEDLCHRVRDISELEGASIELIRESTFAIAKEGLPRGEVFLPFEEALLWADRTTKKDSSWREVYARLDLEKSAKDFLKTTVVP
jgi:hypothetical protein